MLAWVWGKIGHDSQTDDIVHEPPSADFTRPNAWVGRGAGGRVYMSDPSGTTFARIRNKHPSPSVHLVASPFGLLDLERTVPSGRYSALIYALHRHLHLRGGWVGEGGGGGGFFFPLFPPPPPPLPGGVG